MSNEELHELVGAYMIGALSPEEYDQFERHLQSCDACLAEADIMNDGVNALRLAEDYPMPQNLANRVLFETSTEMPKAAALSAGNRLSRRMLALAASILVAVALGSFALSRTGGNLATELAAAADASTLIPDTGQPAVLTVSNSVNGVGFTNVDLDALDDSERYVLWSLDADGSPSFLGFVRDEDQQQVTQAWAHDPATSSAFALSIETAVQPPQAPSDRITYVWAN